MNAVRLVGIGDTHLRVGPRREQILRSLDSIIETEIDRGGVSAWLHLGDVFHVRSTIEDRNAIADRFVLMASIAPVIVLQGNHDAIGDLNIFGRLAATHAIHVVTAPQIVRLDLPEDGNASVFCVPYPSKGQLVADGLPHDELVPAARTALEAIFHQGAYELSLARQAGEPTLLIGHAAICGAVASNGQPQIGVELQLDEALLNLFGPIPKIFGHIHRPQEIGGAWYGGSIARQDSGEIETKRWLTVVCERTDIGWSYVVESHPLEVPPLYYVCGELTREGFAWRVTAGPGGEPQEAPASWKDCEVRCRYTYAQSEKSLLQEAIVHVDFAEAARLELEGVAIPDRALRAPEVAAARTLAEKVEAWARLNGATVTDRVQEKLARLEFGDAAQVLADVTAAAARLETPEKESVAA